MKIVEVLVWNRNGTDVLMSDAGLPRVAVGPHWRDGPPSVVTHAVHDRIGVDVDLVRVGAGEEVEVQCRGPVTRCDLWWTPRPMRPPAPARPDWHRPGWIERVTAELDREAAGIGITRTGAVRQVRHTSVTGMIVVPTTAGELWLKAVLPMFRHEGALTRWLAAGPGAGSVPDVQLTTGAWWLSAGFAAGWPSGPSDGDPLITLAGIQIATVDRIAELHDLGVPARDADDVADRLEAAVRGSGPMGAAQVAAVRAALPALRGACDELRVAGIPNTVVHGDLTTRNVCRSGPSWLLYDWTDVCVGTPFADLAVATMDDDARTTARRALLYAEPWRRHLGSAAVETALRTAPLVGAAHQVAGYLEILAGMEPTGGDRANGAEMERLLAFWAARTADEAARAGATALRRR